MSGEGPTGVIGIIMFDRVEPQMRAPHILNLAQHVGLVLLTTPMIVLRPIVTPIIGWTVIVVLNIR